MDISVDEYTSPVLVMINSNESLDKAREVMMENGIRHLPVQENGKVIGIVSERDILTHDGKDWVEMLKVEDIMNTNIFSVYRNDNLGEVALQLSAQKVGSALVLDDSGEVYGIFTTTDALNALVEILYPQANSKSDLKNFFL